MKKILLASAGLALLCANNVQAAGYQLNEYSTTGLGRSFAGAGVMGDDYSALAYNPAGMTLVKKSGMQLGITEAEMASTVKGEKNEETKMHYGVTLPSGFGQWNVNDKLFLGAGIYAPFGLSTKHKSGSFVGGYARKSELEVIDSSLAAAYKATDKLSLGVSAILRYIHGNMTQNVDGYYMGKPGVKVGEANYDLDGWTGSGSIGAMYEFTPDTRLGVSYKFRSMQKVKGRFTNTAPYIGGVFPDGEASPDLPATLLVSGYHKLNDKIGLSSSVRWTEWSKSFPEFTMTSSSQPGNVTHNYKWRDSWTIAVGADYYINDNWTWRVGTAYDQSPAEDPQNRSNRIPDTDRIWLSTGLSYSTDNWQIDAGIAHLFMKKGWADINGTHRSNTHAEYSSYSNMYGLNFQYKF